MTIDSTLTFNAPEPQFENSMMATANRLFSPSEPSDTPTSTSRLMCYDAAGNLKRDEHVTNAAWMMYDGENKMGRYDPDDAQTSPAYYLYDADGKRKQVIESKTAKHIHGLGGELLSDTSSSTIIKEYAYRNGDLLVTTTVSASNAKFRWLVKDHLGTPRIVADKTGDLSAIKRHDYLPFGEEIGSTVGGRDPSQGYGTFQSDGVRQQFTGYERDDESGLDFAEARMFGSSLGRFSSPDPLLLSATVENPQTWNRYTYALNSPLVQVDEDGLYPSPAYKCADGGKACLNEEQRRILEASKVKIGKEILSGEKLYNKLSEKQQNAFVNLTDKLASLKISDGSSYLSQVRHVKEVRDDRIIAGVRTSLEQEMANSSEFSETSAGNHKPFDAASFKTNDTTFGNIQISLNKAKAGADIDMDVGNIKSGDVAGPVVHGVEVIIHKLFGTTTNQNNIRRLLIANPKVQTITPSPNPKWNRREK